MRDKITFADWQFSKLSLSVWSKWISSSQVRQGVYFVMSFRFIFLCFRVLGWLVGCSLSLSIYVYCLFRCVCIGFYFYFQHFFLLSFTLAEDVSRCHIPMTEKVLMPKKLLLLLIVMTTIMITAMGKNVYGKVFWKSR